MAISRTKIRRVAQDIFEYERLRPGQEEVIQAVLRGQDTLAVLPTGWGKSAIYQITGVLKPGPTVVVSPLIALQRDQFQALVEQEVGGVALLNSTVRRTEKRAIFSELQAGDLEFILLAPEQLARPDVLAELQAAEPSLFVVDEAHCIAEWGHDFRPDYSKLGGVIAALGHPTVLALTATASPPVRTAIIETLQMRDPAVLVHGFDRPNISLEVARFFDEPAKRQALVAQVVAANTPGIVYVATRREAEEIAALLQDSEVAAVAYHAGMRPKARDAAQSAFMADRASVIVATTAFGMGIDKPNVRFVFHYSISESVDAYYQEIGRAGRDGEPASAMLFYNPDDLGLRRFFASGGVLDDEQWNRLVQLIHRAKKPLPVASVHARLDLSQTKLLTGLRILENLGAITTSPADEISWTGALKPQAAIEQASRQQHNQRQFDRSRVEMMRAYAESKTCRRAFILSYFGEEYASPCHSCDVCRAGLAPDPGLDAADQPFGVGSRVCHSAWGEGQVMRYDGDAVVVLFDSVGYKTLALDIVLADGLLVAADQLARACAFSSEA